MGINPTKPQDFFIYADLSPVSLGKILRMLGSKLIIPSPVESAGFPEGLTVSVSIAGRIIVCLFPYRFKLYTVKRKDH